MDVGPKEEAADALVIQEAAVKVARQKLRFIQAVGDTGDISKLFSDSKADARLEVETRVIVGQGLPWWSLWNLSLRKGLKLSWPCLAR